MPDPAPTKQCPKCGNTVRLKDCVRARNPRDRRRWLYKHCRACEAKRQAIIRAQVQADPERRARAAAASREANRRMRAQDPERYRGYTRAYQERVKVDPEARAQFAIRLRFARPHRRLISTAVDAYVPLPAGNVTFLPAAPLVDWLRYEFREWEIRDIAAMATVDEETIRRLLNGQRTCLSLHIADLIFTRAGCPHLLALLYPLTEEPPTPLGRGRRLEAAA